MKHMDIQHKEGQQRGNFFIENEGKRIALLSYDKTDDGTLVIEHTEVDKSLRGQNIGYQLVQRTVEFARSNGLKVSPVCPFAKAIFEKKKEFQEVMV
jgi:predicted GNAT family acetyltransferase